MCQPPPETFTAIAHITVTVPIEIELPSHCFLRATKTQAVIDEIAKRITQDKVGITILKTGCINHRVANLYYELPKEIPDAMAGEYEPNGFILQYSKIVELPVGNKVLPSIQHANEMLIQNADDVSVDACDEYRHAIEDLLESLDAKAQDSAKPEEVSTGNCPTCDSPDPGKHPAMQHEGEVQLCSDPFHTPVDDDQDTLIEVLTVNYDFGRITFHVDSNGNYEYHGLNNTETSAYLCRQFEWGMLPYGTLVKEFANRIGPALTVQAARIAELNATWSADRLAELLPDEERHTRSTINAVAKQIAMKMYSDFQSFRPPYTQEHRCVPLLKSESVYR